jgi:shikimate kinase
MPRDLENVMLAGFMATGKSTVGRALAAQLGRTFTEALAIRTLSK